MNNPIPLFTPDEALAEQSFIGDAMAKLWRRRWSIVLLGASLFLVLAVIIQMLPKIYHGVATVEADAATPQAIPLWSQMRDQQFSDYTLGSEMTILKSPELLTSVIRKLNLTNDPEFNGSLKQSMVGDLVLAYHKLLADYLPNNQAPVVNADDAKLAETLSGLRRKVAFEPVPRSRDIEITVSSNDNQKATQIANAIADAYITSHLDFAEQIMARVHNYTGQELTALARDAASKAQRVAQFKAEHQIVTGREANLLQEQMSQVSTDLNAARANLASLQGRYQAAQKADPESIGAVLGSPTIERLREQEASIGAQRAGMASNYTSGNPTLNRLNAQYADIQNKIKLEANRQIASLVSDIKAQTANVGSLQARLDEMHSQYSKMTTALAQLVPMQGEADAATNSYTSYAQTRVQTDASMLIPATSVRVVSHASVPLYPAFPNNVIMLPAAFALSFVMAGLLGWTRETRRKGVVSSYEIEAVLDVETLGMLPMRTKTTEFMYRDAVEQVFNRLWLFNRPKTILITSALPQEGKTTTALSLAQAAAERDLKVLLIDADMRSKRLDREQKVDAIGLGDVLRGQAVVTDVLSRSGNLTVLPAGQPRGLPTRLLALDKFDQIMGQLKLQYDLVILDAPPSFIGGDCWLLSQKVDRTVFIAKWGATTPAQINEAIRKQLHQDSLAGVVLNMVEPRQNMRYGYVDADYFSPNVSKYYRHPRLQ